MRRPRGDSLRTRFRGNGGLLLIGCPHPGPGRAAHMSELKNTVTVTTKPWLPLMESFKLKYNYFLKSRSLNSVAVHQPGDVSVNVG